MNKQELKNYTVTNLFVMPLGCYIGRTDFTFQPNIPQDVLQVTELQIAPFKSNSKYKVVEIGVVNEEKTEEIKITPNTLSEMDKTNIEDVDPILRPSWLSNKNKNKKVGAKKGKNGKKWFNNGTEEMLIKEEDLPSGDWVRGRVKGATKKKS
jgi:hypothetical protein